MNKLALLLPLLVLAATAQGQDSATNAPAADPFAPSNLQPADLTAERLLHACINDKLVYFAVSKEPDRVSVGVSNAAFRPLFEAFSACSDIPVPPSLADGPAIRFACPTRDFDGPSLVMEQGCRTGVSDAFPGDLFLWDTDNAKTVVRAPGVARLAEEILFPVRRKRIQVEEKLGRISLGTIEFENASPAQVATFLEAETKTQDDPALPEAERGVRFDMGEVDDKPVSFRLDPGMLLADFLDLLRKEWDVEWTIRDGVAVAVPRWFVMATKQTVIRFPFQRPHRDETGHAENAEN